jgi:hypothetical protein
MDTEKSLAYLEHMYFPHVVTFHLWLLEESV